MYIKKKRQTITKVEIVKVIGTIPEENYSSTEALKLVKLLKCDSHGFNSTVEKYGQSIKIKKLSEMLDERYRITDICEFLGRSEKAVTHD